MRQLTTTEMVSLAVTFMFYWLLSKQQLTVEPIYCFTDLVAPVHVSESSQLTVMQKSGL